jgi:hypothetical protein
VPATIVAAINNTVLGCRNADPDFYIMEEDIDYIMNNLKKNPLKSFLLPNSLQPKSLQPIPLALPLGIVHFINIWGYE